MHGGENSTVVQTECFAIHHNNLLKDIHRTNTTTCFMRMTKKSCRILAVKQRFCKARQVDVSCKFSKLQYNSLAFAAGLKRATDKGSLPEIAQYSPYYLPLNIFTASKGSNLYILSFFDAIRD